MDYFVSMFLTPNYLQVFSVILFLFMFNSSIMDEEHSLFSLNPLKYIETCFMAQNLVYLIEYSICILEVVTYFESKFL